MLLTAAAPAHAFKISISDPKVRVQAEPGQVVNGSMRVENPSDQEILIRVYMEDFVYIAPFDGSKKFLIPETSKFSCASWVSFSPQEFTLPPFGKKNIDYTIRVPENARGGHYSVLFFETMLGEMQKEEGYRVNVLGRIGSLFFIEMKGAEKKAEITEIAVKENSFRGIYANTGDLFTKVNTTFYVLDSQSMVIDRKEENEIYILPPDQTEFTLTPSSDLAAGEYTLIATFDLQDGDTLIREIDFSKDRNGKLTIREIRD